MFTGLVQAVGRVVESAALSSRRGPGPRSVRRVRIDPGGFDHRARVGDSISVSGCCLTIARDPAEIGGLLEFHAVPETIARVRPGMFNAGARVNLEAALRAGDAMGGHIVQGHVDGVGEVLRVQKKDGWRVRIRPRKPLDPGSHGGAGGAGEAGGGGLAEYLTPKGSVTVDGVSLTIASISPPDEREGKGKRKGEGGWFEVALIPVTLEKTTLKRLKSGDSVNLEMDILAKTIVFWLRRFAAAR